MLSIRKKIAMSAGLVMATSGIVAAVQSASPATSSPVTVARQQAARPISIIPGAIAPGGTVQTAQSAKWAVVVKYGKAKAGMATKLQKRSGSTWKTVQKGKVDKRGYALFAAPPATRAKPVTYRIDGPGSPSQSASTSRWGTDEDFVDQFSGTSLDLTNWSHRQQFYEPLSRRTCAKGDPRAVKVKDGSARLSMMVDPDRTDLCEPPKPGNPDAIFGKFRYRLQANIGTQGKQTMLYGVAAARIKFNPLQGQHASFWMQPDDPDTATTTGHEIDVIEWFGKDLASGGLTSFVYAPSRSAVGCTTDCPEKIGIGNNGWIVNPDQYLMNAKDRWWKKYHVFTVEWSTSGYVFRIDGKETGRIPASRINVGVASTPEYPILSILGSDYELNKLPKRDEKNNLPQTMYVDWVKTWQNPAFITPTP